jgi:tetratricopeptide (TPR) repeat protein
MEGAGAFDDGHLMPTRAPGSRDGDRVDSRPTSLAIAQRALQQGRYEDAARHLSRAIGRLERKYGSDHVSLVAAIDQLAACHQHRARFVDAGMLYQRALSILDANGLRESLQAADVFHNLGSLEHAAGNWLRGEPFARLSVRMRTRLLGRTHPSVAAGLTALAALIDRQGRFEEAERLYRRALTILEREYGEHHHLVAVALNNLAAVRYARRAMEEAEALYRAARSIEMRQLGPDHPAVAFTTNNLAVLLSETGRGEEAASLFRDAIALFSRSLGPRHPNVGICLENQAQLLRRRRRSKAAAAARRRSARILAEVDAVNDAAVAVTGTVNPLFTSYRLSARPSAIHRLGVFAEEPIPKGFKVIEYTGERISRRESGRRWDPKRSYLFEIDDRLHLDGAIGGSGAEYINHSCAPNLKTRILKQHIIYFSKRNIARGEELTVDYKYDFDTDRMPCTCGAPTCRGAMNELPPTRASSSSSSSRR